MENGRVGTWQLSFDFQPSAPARVEAETPQESKPFAEVICLTTKKREAAKAAIIAKVEESGVFRGFEEA